MPENTSDDLRRIAKELDETAAKKKALKRQKAQEKLDQQLVQYTGFSGGFLGYIWGSSRAIDRFLRDDNLLKGLPKAPAREKLLFRAVRQGMISGLASAVVLGSIAKLITMLPTASGPEAHDLTNEVASLPIPNCSKSSRS